MERSTRSLNHGLWSRWLLTLFSIGSAIGVRAQAVSYLGGFSPGDRIASMAVDATGVYVVGGMSGLQLVESDKIFVGKYDHGGKQLWVRRFGAFFDMASDVALHADSVYVVGFLRGTPFVRKYDPEGNEQWTRTFATAYRDQNFRVVADATGVYLSGNVVRLNIPAMAFLRKYHPDGAEAWNREFTAYTAGVTTDGTRVYIAGQGLLRKYDLNGAEIWTRSPPGAAGRVAADTTGVYVVVGIGDSGGPRRLVYKYDTDGAELWSARVFPQEAINLAVDATGLYVIGSTRSTAPGQCAAGLEDAVVTKFDVNGQELWIRQFGTAGYDFPSGIGVESTGIYIAVGTFLARMEKTPAVIPESVPQIAWECVLSAASLEGGGVAPGEMVTILGSSIGPAWRTPLHVDADGRLATTLADTRILFDGEPAPLLSVSEKQSSAIVPYGVAGKSSVGVQVEFKGARSSIVRVPVLAWRPGIFTLNGSGGGQGAVLNEDGGINSPSNPAQPGSIVSIFATGEGLTEPPGVDGQILRDVLPKPKLPVHVMLVDFMTESLNTPDILYAGGVSGAVGGLLRVNVRLPPVAPGTDSWAVYLFVGKAWEWDDPLPRNLVTISVR